MSISYDMLGEAPEQLTDAEPLLPAYVKAISDR